MGLFKSFKNKPKIKVQTTKKDGFSGWIKCLDCSEMIHAHELENNFHCCPKCNYHYKISVKQRIDLLADKNSFVELFDNIKPKDFLNFEDVKKYSTRLIDAKNKSKHDEAIKTGVCEIFEKRTSLGILDFSFMGGSMGSVVGERITLLIEHSIEKKLPLIMVSASGGARMQESMLSLMQMAKTSAALKRLHNAKLPYISLLTNPTTGGVTASFATLGDIIIAEPRALIGFAGPRVVEQTIGQKLPIGAQKSEFLLERGMIDLIVKRCDLKKNLFFFIDFLTSNDRSSTSEKKEKKLINILENFEKREKVEKL